MKKRIAVFASGRGTNAANIIAYFGQHPSIEVAIVVTNRLEAGVVQVAADSKIPCFVLEGEEVNDAKLMLDVLRNEEIHFVVLAGYMRKIPEAVTRAYAGKMINVHPALLPDFGGKGMYGKRVHEAVKSSGRTETGITIHLVNEEYDEGAVLFQARCAISPTESVEEIEKKVHTLEYRHYPEIIEKTILQHA